MSTTRWQQVEAVAGVPQDCGLCVAVSALVSEPLEPYMHQKSQEVGYFSCVILATLIARWMDLTSKAKWRELLLMFQPTVYFFKSWLYLKYQKFKKTCFFAIIFTICFSSFSDWDWVPMCFQQLLHWKRPSDFTNLKVQRTVTQEIGGKEPKQTKQQTNSMHRTFAVTSEQWRSWMLAGRHWQGLSVCLSMHYLQSWIPTAPAWKQTRRSQGI